MADKIKLGEISKNLKITNKDIIAKLAEFGVELKSSASVVDEGDEPSFRGRNPRNA